MAFALGVIASSTCLESRLKVSGSMSTKTGLAPNRTMAPTVAKKVYGVVMTSSPGPISTAIKVSKMASDPDPTPTACVTP